MNTIVLEIDFSRKENNSYSQSFLNANLERITKSNMKVLELLKEGKRLTVLNAAKDYNISSLPRRIKDLRDIAGIPVQQRSIGNRCVEYYL